MTWTFARYTVITDHAAVEVKGRSNGVLGVAMFSGRVASWELPWWTIAHVASGAFVALVQGERPEVERMADRLTGCLDWSFTETDILAEGCRRLALNERLLSYGPMVIRPHPIEMLPSPPTWDAALKLPDNEARRHEHTGIER